MSKDTIKVNMNVYDIPIIVEQLKKLEQENKQLKEKIDILLEDNNQLEEIRIKAIEYIKNNSHKVEWGDPESQDEESIDINDDTTETEFIEQLLEILGDGNNE